MSSPLMSCAQVRALEQRALAELGLPSLVLMENAGRGLAELLLALGLRAGGVGEVVICCGKGNNGGDGAVLARHLYGQQVDRRVLLFGRPEELTGDAALNWQVLTRSGLSVKGYPGLAPDLDRIRDELAGADWVVDALFGTGLRGPLRPPFDAIVDLINESPARVL